MSRRKLFLLALILTTISAIAQTKVEPLGAFESTAAKPALVSAVEPNGYRVPGVADIWFAKALPGSGQASGSALYPQLKAGQFVGVITFTAPAKDFRGQPVRPGTYTMRYELLPGDGNHMGAAPDPDFVLLVPIADDADPATPVKYADLTKMSSKAAGTNHAASFSMAAPDLATVFPSTFLNDDGFTIFAAKVKTGSTETPFAIVLKGQAAQ